MNIALMVTCLADQFSPQVGVACVRLLEKVGAKVSIPQQQTCCGQPAYNAGYREDAKAIARHTLKVFSGFDHVVTPSGSCGGMLTHYAELFSDEPETLKQAWQLQSKTYEISQFLVDVAGVEDAKTLGAPDLTGKTIAYHHSCHAKRLMQVYHQPKLLLQSLGATLLEWSEDCCGFGGLFSVKMPEVSGEMLKHKLASLPSEPEMLVSSDLGCLMQLGGGLNHQGKTIPTVGIAQLLAGMA